MNRNSTIDFSGTDRISRTINDVLYNSTYGMNVRRSQTYAYITDNSSVSLLVAKLETSTDGLRSWQTQYRNSVTPVVTQTQTEYNMNDGVSAAGYRTVTVTRPDNSKIVTVYYQGRLLSVTRKSSTGTQITKTTYAYDPHGRQYTATDARNGATTYGYNNADQVFTVTTPAPAVGQSAQITTTFYDTSLRAWKITQPDNTGVTNEYYPTGLLKRIYGSRTYPVGHGYDAQGRMTMMTNWTGFAAGAGTRVTTWNYNTYRGWLDSKDYPDATTGQPPATPGTTGPTYAYTDAGRMQTRTWLRTGTDSQRIVTTYAYNNAGDPYTVIYSPNDPAGTPGATYAYDRRGRQKTLTRGGTTTTLTYNDANQLLTESYSGGTLGGFTFTGVYDTVLRRTSLSVNTSPANFRTYGYDYASRLTNVTDGTYSGGYTYLANSPLVSQITFKQSTTTRMTTTKNYDYLDRLTSISSVPAAQTGMSIFYGYAYNPANQRTQVKLNDKSYWVYQYDALGQVTSGKRYWSDGTPVAGQQFEYGFDDIGNRASTKAGGDGTGNNLRPATYFANTLNQYTSRTVTNAVDILGIANAGGTVTVNSQSVYRRYEYFDKALTIDNSNAPVWQSVTNSATGATTVTGNVWVPKTPENYGYDLDGNQTSDGRWNYTWDAENRLIRLVANTAVGPQQRIDFEYDWQGRRIAKKVWNNTGGTGTPATYLKFVYDGWNVIAELDGNNANALKRSFIWGLDLSGSMQGAGGVGGLLAIKPTSGNPTFAAYDANGNVTGLIDATTGTTTGNFEYGPFGEIIRLTPNANNQSPFRFSTKYTDDESDFLYYGYRYYNTSTGRWLSRDTIGEKDTLNLYAFTRNRAIDNVDLLGKCICGADVTAPAAKTLGIVRQSWDHAMATKTKKEVCKTIIGFGPEGVEGASHAWDIVELAYTTPTFQKCMFFDRGGQGDCYYTAGFAGGCYYASQINFALFGTVFKLCHDTEDVENHDSYTEATAEFFVRLWKRWRYPDAPQIYTEQAVDFTKFGYSEKDPSTHKLSCAFNSTKAKQTQFDWTLDPYKPRKQPKCAQN